MNKFNKLIYICLAGLLLATSIPFEFIHHFIEKHDDEIHVCDYDVCVREFTHECQIDSQIITKKYAFSDSNDNAVIFSIEEVNLRIEVALSNQHFFSFKVRGPPAIV